MRAVPGSACSQIVSTCARMIFTPARLADIADARSLLPKMRGFSRVAKIITMLMPARKDVRTIDDELSQRLPSPHT